MAGATLDKPIGEFHRRLTTQHMAINPLRVFMPMPMLYALAWNAVATFHAKVNEFGGEQGFPDWPMFDELGDEHASDFMAFERVCDKILWLNTQLDEHHLHLAWCAEFRRNGGWTYGPKFSQRLRTDPNLVVDPSPDCHARVAIMRATILACSIPIEEADFTGAKRIGLDGRTERGRPETINAAAA